MLKLTASDLPRFMACNGSRLLEGVPPFDTDRSLADEGDAVHWLIEQVFKGKHSADELVDRKAPNGVFITGEMVEHADQYLSDITSEFLLGSAIRIEEDTSFSDKDWSIGGRADSIWLSGSRMTIPDFKYGWKIVEPENNWTLISHAIGFLSRNGDYLQAVREIRFRIYQPRPYHPRGKMREWVISYNELMQYWQQMQSALNSPSDVCQTSANCYKCPSRSQCPALQIASMNAIDTAHSAFDSEVSNADLSSLLDNLSRAQEVLKQSYDAFEELALHRLQAGQFIPEYTMQSGKGKTQWNKGITADFVQALTGVDVSEKNIVSPAQAKKAGVSEVTLAVLTDRPNTGLKLVRQDVSKKAEKLLGKRN